MYFSLVSLFIFLYIFFSGIDYFLRQEPYDPDEFVERLAYRVFGNSEDNDNTVIDDVQDTFVQAIK